MVIVITTHNLGKRLSECLQSAIDLAPKEIIIVDNASTDDSPNILKNFHFDYPDIIHPILLTKKISSKDAFSIGCSAADSDIIYTLSDRYAGFVFCRYDLQPEAAIAK